MIFMSNAKKGGILLKTVASPGNTFLLRERVIYLKGYAVFFIKKG